MSLRGRLVTALLLVAAGGLVLLAGVTYVAQRSYLNERVDQQTRAALPALARELDDRGARVPGAPQFDLPDEPGGPGGPAGGFDPSEANLPPGTYGERRDASGRVLGRAVLSYGQDPLPAPDLPGDIETADLLTVDAKGGSGLRYRVRVVSSPGDSGVTVVAVPLNDTEETLDRLLVVEGLVIACVLLLLAALSWMLVRVGLRPLERIGHTADAIAGGDMSRRVDPATPRTEVGRLGLALNAMLERLETAFAEREASEERLRQFLSDASHELRTPLASIRGYAELYRIGAARGPEDSERAMRRIEDEAERMGVLVEDMLTLARLDEVRDVTAQEVDLADLVQDAVGDARATAPEREIAERIDEPLTVEGDPDRLRQVLGNLLRNALGHTPDATPIEISLRRAGDQAEIEVRDHGPGLPPGAPGAIFERFWRAESGRERGRAGAGLGLAIVAGIVEAHGGTATAVDAAGGGASFVVLIPLAGTH